MMSITACNLIAKVNFHRCVITSVSTTGEVMEQEKMIQSVLEELEKMVRQHPEINENKDYSKFMEAVDSYGRMLQTSNSSSIMILLPNSTELSV